MTWKRCPGAFQKFSGSMGWRWSHTGQHTDSPGPINGAESKAVFAIDCNSDMSEYGETAHLTATVHNWMPLYAAKVMAVPKDVQGYVNARRDAISDDSLHTPSPTRLRPWTESSKYLQARP